MFFGGLALIGSGLVFYVYFLRSVKIAGPSVESGLEQSSIITSTPSESPLTSLTPRPTPEPFLGLNGVKAPATCQIDGQIDFLDWTTFSTKNSKISWQNVDSQGRPLNWKINPQDDLKIGPNLFANLVIPNGTYDNLTIRLPDNPIAKQYTLTTSITYGQFIGGDLKVKETNCAGEVRVNLNF